MAHAVETMMYSGQVPWHGLGNAVTSNLPWDDAIVAAGLDWDVNRVPLYLADGTVVPDAAAMVRATDGMYYGTVGSKYAKVLNREAFGTFHHIFGDASVLHTAGSLHDGRVVWGLAEIPGEWTIGNDKHKRYLLVTTTHDGSGALRVYPTAVRVVCNNTLAASKGDAKSGIAIRHRGDAVGRLKEKAMVLADSLGWFGRYQEDCTRLLNTIINKEQSRELVSELLNADSTQGKRAIDLILDLASNGAGNRAVAGTAYGLFQGVTDYVDHARQPGQSGEARMANVTLGSGAALKARALELFLEQAPVATPTAVTPSAPVIGPLSDLFSGTMAIAD